MKKLKFESLNDSKFVGIEKSKMSQVLGGKGRASSTSEFTCTGCPDGTTSSEDDPDGGAIA